MHSDPSLNAHTGRKVIPVISLLKLWWKMERGIFQHSLLILQIAVPRQTININHAPVVGYGGEVLGLPSDRIIL